MGFFFNPLSGSLDYYKSADLSAYVPYTGAGADIDLGGTYKIIGCADPGNPGDVMTLNYAGLNFVPYIGAVADCDLGAFQFTAAQYNVGTAFYIKTGADETELIIGENAANLAIGNTERSTFIGSDAGVNSNNINYALVLGSGAGENATYDGLGPAQFGSTWIGFGAGNSSTNAYGTLGVGAGALGGSTGYYNSAFGLNAMASSSVTNSLGIGGYCFEFASGNNCVGIGEFAFQFASNPNESVAIGSLAGSGSTDMVQSLCFGANSGNGSTGAYVCAFIGPGSGQYSSGLESCLAVGANAMTGCSSAQLATAVGNAASHSAQNANFSVSIGAFAGGTYDVFSSDINRSTLIGAYSGAESPGANDCIFIGYYAGTADTVDNLSTPGWNILLGRNTNTAGFKNSIAIGGYTANSAAAQCNIGNALYIDGIYTTDSQSATPVGTAKVGVNTDTPQAELDVVGEIQQTQAQISGSLKVKYRLHPY